MIPYNAHSKQIFLCFLLLFLISFIYLSPSLSSSFYFILSHSLTLSNEKVMSTYFSIPFLFLTLSPSVCPPTSSPAITLFYLNFDSTSFLLYVQKTCVPVVLVLHHTILFTFFSNVFSNTTTATAILPYTTFH